MRKVLFILGELEDTDLDWMILNGAKRSCAPGSILIRQGVPTEAVYVVLDGRLAVTLGSRTLAELRAGEVLGELSFLDSRPPSATVSAVEPSTVLSIPRDRLTTRLGQDVAFAARFYRALGVFLASRLRRTQEGLGYDPAAGGEPRRPEAGEDLDPDVLDGVALAGARFEWMLRQLRNAPAGPPIEEPGSR